MNLLHRRILYSLFFLAFFITAPLIILWAQGYRYNFGQHCLQKTGVLFLESKPLRANIFLNNRQQKETTSARLKNLLPDDYLVKIEKNGFQTWQKKMKVKAGQTTFAQYIRLFKIKPEIETVFPQKIIKTSQNSTSNLALVYQQHQQNQLAIFDLKNQNLVELTSLNFTPQKIILSPQAKFILLFTPHSEKIIFDVAKKRIINLNHLTKQNILQARWQKNKRDEIIFLQTNNYLLKMNLVSQQAVVLLKKPIINFYLFDEAVYFLEKTPEQILLKKIDFNRPTEQPIISTLPISKDYQFQNSFEPYLTLLDRKNNIFYLINVNSKKKKIFPEVKQINWSPDNKTILLTNDFEISVYDLAKRSQNLITRLSDKILQTAWYLVPTHIIYLTKENIKAVENVNTEKQFNILVTQKKIQQFFVADEDKIYFINEQGLNLAKIQ